MEVLCKRLLSLEIINIDSNHGHIISHLNFLMIMMMVNIMNMHFSGRKIVLLNKHKISLTFSLFNRGIQKDFPS